MRSTRPRRQRGTTLLEALVLFLVLSLGMLAVARMQVNLRVDADIARQRSEAVRLAQQEIEGLRGFASVAAAPGLRAYASIANATRSVSGTTTYVIDRRVDAADWPHLKSVTVAVSWPAREGGAHSVSLQTLIADSDPVLSGALALRPP